jgi:hypothetical protein
VAISPWCDLTVDGSPRGRSPTTLQLSPGPHQIDCVNPASGQALHRAVVLVAGEESRIEESLYRPARLTARLARADAYRVDEGPTGPSARDVAPGRRRITLFAGGRELEGGYVDVGPGGCRLVDTPSLACENP